MKIKKQIPLLLIVFLVAVHSNIPTIQPENATLYQSSNYVLNYYSVKNFTSLSYFDIDFSASDITVPNSNATNNCLVSIGDRNATLPTCSCTSSICRIKPNMITNTSANVVLTFGPLVNPPYFYQQKVNAFISFFPSNNETSNVVISSSIYQSMPIILNSFKQSDYGVGSNNVEYDFNLSFSYYPKNPQIQITIPS